MTTLEAQHEVITNLILENEKLKRERDEAREDTPWHSNGETKGEWLSRQREKYAVLERERDELLQWKNEVITNLIRENEKLKLERDEARAVAKLAYSILAKVNRRSLEDAAARSSIKHINNTPMEWLYSIIQNWK